MCSYKILNGGTTTKRSRIPWQTSVVCFYFILALMKIASSEAMPSIKEFFPSINNDLAKVSWSYDVYDDETFQWALEAKVMMIDGDVELIKKKSARFGKKVSQELQIHSKYSNTGMNLKHFLKKVAGAKSVGVKLNFDQISAFEESIKVLQAMRGELKFPLWLNAVTNNMEEKDIDKFLSLCTHNFPEATISIGMLHKGQKLNYKEGYTAKLVTQMKDTLTRNNVTQTVAFPVDIFEAAYSLDTLPALKDVHGITDSALCMNGHSLQIFNQDNFSRLKKLIENFGRNRVYLGVPVLIRSNLINML